MKIIKLKTNHITNPLGFAFEKITLSYVVTECKGAEQRAARIQVAEDEKFLNIVHDSGFTKEIDSIAYPLPFAPAPATRYYWKVYVEADNGEKAESGIAWFETAQMMETITADFIVSEKSRDVDYFTKQIMLPKNIMKARAYVTALGVYEFCVNGEKAGEEYLAPGSNDYDSWLQYQTYDVTKQLQKGENTLVLAVAPGWYSGYFGFSGQNETYGKEKAVMCQLEVTYRGGSTEIFCTDESWMAGTGKVQYSEIYHGEVQDMTCPVKMDAKVQVFDFDRTKLSARRSLPVVIKEVMEPKRVIRTPKGETVIDLGQNMAGWVSFICREPKGTKLHFQYGEVLQDGNFYRDNLRTAKAEFTYVSDGEVREVRPHFTYYGFRYVKVEGNTKAVDIKDFKGEVVYSDMDTIGSMTTSNPLVNRLILNALWGQKGNFVEVPTDCPQRDERMGWTGDAQVFSGTAAFQMDVFAFFAKYGYDMLAEQEKYEGCVPMVIPSFHMGPGGSSAWADAATVIPWNVYVYSGDKAILEQQYPSMKLWADYIHRQDEENGGTGLWRRGFHFGDWLALDGDDPSIPTGATERFYVASCYYYLSTLLTAKAAEVLKKNEEAELYFARAEKVKAAIQEEYFTTTGRCAIPTQTGYILALAFDICPEEFKARMAADLNARLEKDGHLMTGFVGTPYLCKVLSEYGYHEMAFKLLLHEEYPGWLYPVRMGATTIWERWNSIMPDGHLSPDGMNSLNHYSYGAIVEWLYRYVAGINPWEEEPGFRKVRIAPKPDYRMSHVEMALDSPVGTYESSWTLKKGKLQFRIVVPFGGAAQIILPDARIPEVSCKNPAFLKQASQEGENVMSFVPAGTYEISYKPTKPYEKGYNRDSKLSEILKKPELVEKLFSTVPDLKNIPLEMHADRKLIELAFDQMMPLSMKDVEKIERALKAYKIQPDVIPEMIMDI